LTIGFADACAIRTCVLRGLVAVVMASASSDYAAQLVPRAIENVAETLVEEEEEASGIMQRDRAEQLGQLRCCLTAWRNAFISVPDLKW
jgi:hypothetical protein